MARGTDGISEPRRAIVEDAAALWRTATGRRLAIVGGDPRLSAAAILFLPDQPQAWPAYDPDRAPWVTARAVAEHGMVAFCRLRDEGCLRGAKDVAAAPTVLCIVRDRSHYLGKVGPVREVIVVLVPPAGVQVPAKFACLTAVD